ncbi:MAG: rRNA maturation RNase YbeY [Pseudomonadota bacterium]
MTAVDLVVEEPAWLEALPDLADIAERAAGMALRALEDADPAYQICVMACGDDRIADLNAEFRGKPVPTNVLSWPAFDLAPTMPGGAPAKPPPAPVPGEPVFLGDVAIALQVVMREADAASLPLKTHATHLILHACLHLLGYDHETPEDAGLMEAFETRSMIEAGFDDPYA